MIEGFYIHKNLYITRGEIITLLAILIQDKEEFDLLIKEAENYRMEVSK